MLILSIQWNSDRLLGQITVMTILPIKFHPSTDSLCKISLDLTTPPYSHIALWSYGFPVVSLVVCLDRWPPCWSGWCISTDTAGRIWSGETSAAASSVPSCYTL